MCWNQFMSMSPLSSAGFGCVYSVKLRISTSMPCFSFASFTRARCDSFSDTTPMRTVWAPSSLFSSACELQAVRANAPTAARDRPAKERREMFEGVVMGFSLEDGATSPARVGTAGAERCGVGRAVGDSPRGTARRAGGERRPEPEAGILSNAALARPPVTAGSPRGVCTQRRQAASRSVATREHGVGERLVVGPRGPAEAGSTAASPEAGPKRIAACALHRAGR